MEKAVNFIKRHADGSAAIAIFLVTLLFFLPGVNFDPIPMDQKHYIGKEYLLYFNWQNLIYHLKTPILDLHSPLVMYSFMLDFWLWGKDLFLIGGRIHNILLHAGSATLFYLLLRKLKLVRLNKENPFTLSIPAAVFAALCFALHPQRIESVIWIAERKDTQAIFLGMLSTWFFVKSFQKNRLPLAGALVYFLSFGAKPTVITLPGVLLLGIWVCTEKFDWKKALKMLSPYIAAALVYIVLNAAQLHSFAGASADGLFSVSRIKIVIMNYANYFFSTLLPLNIQPLYPVFKWNSKMILLCVLFWGMCAAVIITALLKIRKREIFSCFAAPLFLAFLGVLLPMAGFKSIGNAEFADRYSYYPAIFIWIGMAAALEYFSVRNFLLKFAFWAYSGVIVILGFCYLQTWQTTDSFINAALGNGADAHPAVLRMAAWSSFEKNEFDSALNFARQAAVNNGNQEHDQLFVLALEGLVELSCDNPGGLEKIDRAITNPKWGHFLKSNQLFSETVLLISAQAHLKKNTPQDIQFAVTVFDALGHITDGSDPLKELNYRALAAFFRKDYATAEKLASEALTYSPDDENLRINLQKFRELRIKNSPAEAASTE